ncbi:hypothetical protein BH23CHL8_BH23CHL8_11700 [soil metagenome]
MVLTSDTDRQTLEQRQRAVARGTDGSRSSEPGVPRVAMGRGDRGHAGTPDHASGMGCTDGVEAGRVVDGFRRGAGVMHEPSALGGSADWVSSRGRPPQMRKMRSALPEKSAACSSRLKPEIIWA